MSALITLDALSARTPDGRVLFENLTLALGRERTGLVGRNGVGKTTLGRLILGEAQPARGSVSVQGRVAVLRQTLAPAPDALLGDVLGVRASMARLRRIEAGAARGNDLERADWLLPGRVDAALARCGLAGLALERPAASLSGGQATRAALAGLLIAEPDFIILDEPTNNLDADGREAVRALLAEWRGGALVISHDRALLREMDRMVELSELGARVYGGGYDLYEARKSEERANAARTLERAEREADLTERKIQVATERKVKRDAAGKKSRARGDMPKILLDARADQAEKSAGRGSVLAERQREAAQARLAEAQAAVEKARRLAFALPSSGLHAGKGVLAFERVTFAWPDGEPIVRDFSFEMRGPERVALRGRNGAGKSTLIGLASGAIAPQSGRVVRWARSAVLDQRAAMLCGSETLVDNYLRLNPEANTHVAHEALARFLFRNRAALKRADELSGGERLRAALACVLFSAAPPHLLILDEPTNHLDLDSVAAIEAALAGYDGAVLAASHDEDFLAAIGIERALERWC